MRLNNLNIYKFLIILKSLSLNFFLYLILFEYKHNKKKHYFIFITMVLMESQKDENNLLFEGIIHMGLKKRRSLKKEEAKVKNNYNLKLYKK